MGILDIFKKKKKKPEKAKRIEKPKKKEIKKVPKVKVERKPAPARRPTLAAKPPEVRAPKVRRRRKFREAYRILKEPHVSEKATDLTAKNQYVFKVWPRSNKIEIKKTIESLYGVDVLNVRIIKIPRKRRRLGRIEGWRKGYKKAIVKIREGQKIEVLPR